MPLHLRYQNSFSLTTSYAADVVDVTRVVTHETITESSKLSHPASEFEVKTTVVFTPTKISISPIANHIRLVVVKRICINARSLPMFAPTLPSSLRKRNILFARFLPLSKLRIVSSFHSFSTMAFHDTIIFIESFKARFVPCITSSFQLFPSTP